MDDLALTPLDGMDTIGGTKLLLEADGRSLMLDFGLNFARMGMYYEEYLRPRSTTGLLDHVTMGTLPDVRGVYRQDLAHPDLELTGPELPRVDAVLLSHGHVDHSGDIGFLRTDIPVATSAMSAAIVKASQDVGRNELGREPVYATIRETVVKRDARVLKSSRAHRELVGRDYWLMDAEPSDELEEFWRFLPSYEMSQRKGGARSLSPGELSRGADDLGFEMFAVDHSIKGAGAFIIGTSRGGVVYSGDIRMHGMKGEDSGSFVRKARAGDPYVLIIEGTRARSGEDPCRASVPNASEAQVGETAARLVDDAKGGLVVADFGPRNIERLEIFLDVARRAHRSLVVTTKDAYLLRAMNCVDRSVPVPGDDMRVYDSPKGSDEKYEEWVLDRACPDCLVTPSAVGASPGDYMVCFSFFDIKHLIDIRPDGGHYLYSSSEAHSEEQEIDFRRLHGWLDRFGLVSHGFDVDGEGVISFGCEAGPLHASGHASKEDLESIVRGIDPEVVVPVHTEDPGWFVTTFGEERKVLLPRRGDRMTL